MSRLACLGAVLLAGCVPQTPPTYVMNLQPADTTPLVEAIDAFVLASLHGQPTVLIQAPPDEREIAPALRERLTGQGFAVGDVPAPQTHRIGYVVTPFEDGAVLVQVFVDGRRAARVYGRDRAGTLRPKGPYLAQQAVS